MIPTLLAICLATELLVAGACFSHRRVLPASIWFPAMLAFIVAAAWFGTTLCLGYSESPSRTLIFANTVALPGVHVALLFLAACSAQRRRGWPWR